MAIYHHSTQVITRSAGKSAPSAAAYRSGEKIVDSRTAIVHDYTKKTGIEHTEILTPIPANSENAWLKDRSQLWNKIEAVEKRHDAQLAREINIAIPVELDHQNRIALVREYVQTSYVNRGMVADICFHDFQTNNPHAHIMLTMRELVIDDDGAVSFGKKERAWNDRKLLIDQRREWAEIANQYLAKAGYDVQIDHRSLVEQGITDRLPQIHLGADVAAMRAKGIPTERGDEYDRIARANAEIRDRLEKIYQAEVTLTDLGKAEMEIEPRPVNEQPTSRGRRHQPNFERNRRDFEEFANSLQSPQPETRQNRPLDRDRRTHQNDRQTERTGAGERVNPRQPHQQHRAENRQDSDLAALRAEFDRLGDQIGDREVEPPTARPGLDRDWDVGTVRNDAIGNGLGDNRHQEQAGGEDRAGTGGSLHLPGVSEETRQVRETGAAAEEKEEEVTVKPESIKVIFKPDRSQTRPRQGGGLSL